MGRKTRRWNGRNLIQARHRRGWSQDELARAVPTSVTNISRWERGKHVPGGGKVAALAEALGVTEGSFFQANGDEPDSDDEESDLGMSLAFDIQPAIDAFGRPHSVALFG